MLEKIRGGAVIASASEATQGPQGALSAEAGGGPGLLRSARNDGGGQSAGTLSSAKEKDIKQRGLVLILSELHDEVDRLTADSYGWPRNLLEDDVLARLDAERAKVTLTGRYNVLGKSRGGAVIASASEATQGPQGAHSAEAGGGPGLLRWRSQ